VLAAAVGPAAVAVLDLTRRGRTDRLPVDRPISLAFTPDGRELLVGRAGTGVVAFTVPRGQPQPSGLEDLPGPVWRLRFAPNAATVAVCHGSAVRFQDTSQGTTCGVVDFDPNIGVQDCVLFPDADNGAAALHIRRFGALGRTE